MNMNINIKKKYKVIIFHESICMYNKQFCTLYLNSAYKIVLFGNLKL